MAVLIESAPVPFDPFDLAKRPGYESADRLTHQKLTNVEMLFGLSSWKAVGPPRSRLPLLMAVLIESAPVPYDPFDLAMRPGYESADRVRNL